MTKAIIPIIVVLLILTVVKEEEQEEDLAMNTRVVTAMEILIIKDGDGIGMTMILDKETKLERRRHGGGGHLDLHLVLFLVPVPDRFRGLPTTNRRIMVVEEEGVRAGAGADLDPHHQGINTINPAAGVVDTIVKDPGQDPDPKVPIIEEDIIPMVSHPDDAEPTKTNKTTESSRVQYL